jgi:hypothetical protein
VNQKQKNGQNCNSCALKVADMFDVLIEAPKESKGFATAEVDLKSM